MRSFGAFREGPALFGEGAAALGKGSAARLALKEQSAIESTPMSTIDTVQAALASLAGRYQTDEVLTAVRHIPAREAQYRPRPNSFMAARTSWW